MRIAIEVDEHAFLHPKSREDVEREVLEAASFYWLARRDIEQVGAQRVARPLQRNLVDVLLSAPNVGEDADFERAKDLGRAGLEWGARSLQCVALTSGRWAAGLDPKSAVPPG